MTRSPPFPLPSEGVSSTETSEQTSSFISFRRRAATSKQTSLLRPGAPPTQRTGKTGFCPALQTRQKTFCQIKGFSFPTLMHVWSVGGERVASSWWSNHRSGPSPSWTIPEHHPSLPTPSPSHGGVENRNQEVITLFSHVTPGHHPEGDQGSWFPPEGMERPTLSLKHGSSKHRDLLGPTRLKPSGLHD